MLVERLRELKQNAANLAIKYSQRMREDTAFMLSYSSSEPADRFSLRFGRAGIIAGFIAQPVAVISGSLVIALAGDAVLGLGILHVRWLKDQVQNQPVNLQSVK